MIEYAMKTVKLLATLRDIAGASQIEVSLDNVATVGDLIDAIGVVCPELKDMAIDEAGELTGIIHIMVNGRNIVWLQGMDTAISAADELCVMPMVGGG
jgi:molybdopterin synthase sulfur carrier subunit